MFITFAISILSLNSGALAWGSLGHETVGYIAQNYVSDETKTFCQDILEDTGDSYLAAVATWADSYRREEEGKFSAPFHYIDAEDSPPSSCNVDLQRDCAPEGCVVSAIQNYTTRVQDQDLAQDQRSDALKFIVHFLGDIHQPLHNEATAVGGNKINVTFDGDETNLHAIWDTDIPEKLLGGGTESDALTWSKNLTKAIDDGVYKEEKAQWLVGMSQDSSSSALVWARDANAYICSKVLPDGAEAVETDDLAGEYYDSVVDTVELQIAKAGYRLAGWLNQIATGDIGLEVAQNATLHSSYSTFARRGFRANMYSAAKLARREFGSDCNCGKH